MRSTIKDIAKIAGVSPSTVSRVISGSEKISKETRDKILRIIEQTNYHPNIMARSLVKQESKIIGVAFPGSTNEAFRHPFYREIFAGIVTLAHEKGYKILLSSVLNDKKSYKWIIDDLTQGAVTDGLIIISLKVNDQVVNHLVTNGFPFVAIGRPKDDSYINWVDNDNVKISFKMTEHLIKKGHKKIAFIGAAKSNVITVDRLQGYKEALENYEIPFEKDLVCIESFSSNKGYKLTQRLMERKVGFTSLVGTDDYLAFRAIKYLTESGLKVPQDVAVAGFNNVPSSEYFDPPLTTVEVNPFKLGLKAAEILITNLNSSVQSFNRAFIPAELVIRKST